MTNFSQIELGNHNHHFIFVGFIIGVGGGDGTLHLKGQDCRLRIDGVSAGTMESRLRTSSAPPPIRAAADVAGTYSAVSGSSNGEPREGGGRSYALLRPKPTTSRPAKTIDAEENPRM